MNDELIQHFKNLEEDETLKRIDDAYNRGWNDAMNSQDVKKALERMKPVSTKPEKLNEYHPDGNVYLIRCVNCKQEFKLIGFQFSREIRHCTKCGQAQRLIQKHMRRLER